MRTEEIEKSQHTPVVIIVDDDELVTTTLLSYLELETDYRIYAYQSPFKALEAMRKIQPDVIISDFLMPDMDGLQLLAEVKKMYPDVTKILLTGYADKENAIKAINEVGLFQYVEKPWDNDNLRLLIRNGISNKTLRSVLDQKVRELDKVLLEKDALVQRNEMFKHEMLLAQNVQQSMLPQNFPESNGFSFFAKYEPALEVGGDFYDVVQLADDKLSILLADVTGHGIQAALMTVLLKSAFSVFKDSRISPREMLIYMNTMLCKILPLTQFVAALVAVLDPRNATCTLANAGVPYPYHLKRSRNTVERIPVNGLLLGIADEGIFKPGDEYTTKLAPGDSLIFLTDGLTEAENDADEHFESRLLTTLDDVLHKSSEEILQELIQAARKFSTSDHKWDDIAILGVELKS
ncbi:MAG: PP2C family protein-serine/threonine phosphatase [bacterium]